MRARLFGLILSLAPVLGMAQSDFLPRDEDGFFVGYDHAESAYGSASGASIVVGANGVIDIGLTISQYRHETNQVTLISPMVSAYVLKSKGVRPLSLALDFGLITSSRDDDTYNRLVYGGSAFAVATASSGFTLLCKLGYHHQEPYGVVESLVGDDGRNIGMLGLGFIIGRSNYRFRIDPELGFSGDKTLLALTVGLVGVGNI